MEMQMLDWVLVPMGLGLLVAYHLWLIHMIMKQPTNTVIGINAINRRFWVHVMMEDMKNGVLAVQTLRNNIMASTLLASTAIMMSSVIAVLMSHGRIVDQGGSLNVVVLGSRGPLSSSIKYFSILACFLIAFLLNLQSVRYYSHASILVNVPFKKLDLPYLNAEYVARTLNRGSYFWSLGLRAFYFSVPLFLWIFGPLPMFFSCLALVFILYFLDVTSEFRAIEGAHEVDLSNNDVEQSR